MSNFNNQTIVIHCEQCKYKQKCLNENRIQYHYPTDKARWVLSKINENDDTCVFDHKDYYIEESNMELSEQDINALKLREELLKLCKKYKCTIESAYDDEGNITFDFQDKSYHIDTEKYKIFIYDVNNEREYLIDKYIKSNLHKEKSELQLRTTNKNIGVFTTDYEKALFKIFRIKDSIKDEDIVKFVKSKYVIELRLKDGIRYKWINPNDTVRGNRCSKAIIDRGLTLEQIQNVFLTAIPYFSIDDVEIF